MTFEIFKRLAASTAAFTAGNIVVSQVAASAVNATGSIVELNPSTPSTPIQTIPVPDGVTNSNGLRFSGWATSTGYLAATNDGTIISFAGANSNNTTANVNALISRGVGTFNGSGIPNLATTYTGASDQQTRGATSINKTTAYIGDQNGLYTNGSTAPSPSGNFRSVKSFGGIVYGFQASTTVPYLSTISAPLGGTVAGLPGLPNGTISGQDFYLISSGSSGAAFDVLYIVATTSATAGTIGGDRHGQFCRRLQHFADVHRRNLRRRGL